MKRLVLALLVMAACAVLWAAHEKAAAAPERSFAHAMPQGALFVVESPDFGAILRQWNSSQQKQAWLKSANYSVFMSSHLLQRLQDAQGEFATAAGVTPNLPFLQEIAGSHSAIAVYDIGGLEMLYLSHVENAKSLNSALWQKRSQFEPRQLDGRPFYVRTDPQSGRVVAFAIAGDTLVLGTREDLVAGALALLSGGKMSTVADEAWYDTAVKAAHQPGELRMVLHLSEMVKTPHFRSYWVQRNITELGQYESAVSDLRLASDTYREERVLLPRSPMDCNATMSAASAAANLVRYVPGDMGFYRSSAAPSVDDALAALETKVLTPRAGRAADSRLAPSVAETAPGETALDARIDLAPSPAANGSASDQALRALLSEAAPQAVLTMYRSAAAADGVFMRLHSTVVLAAAHEWSESASRTAVKQLLASSLTTSTLGAEWKAVGDGAARHYELDGLATVALAVRGNLLFVSNDPETLSAALARTAASAATTPALYLARFDHARERANYARLTALIDRPALGQGGGQPEFFSQNIASLSQVFAQVQSESVTATCAEGNTVQTVVYEWSR